jgi:hypothetical protein
MTESKKPAVPREPSQMSSSEAAAASEAAGAVPEAEDPWKGLTRAEAIEGARKAYEVTREKNGGRTPPWDQLPREVREQLEETIVQVLQDQGLLWRN